MDKAHDVQRVAFSGTTMLLRVDGKEYRIDITKESDRLAKATQEQRENFEVSPAGYAFTGRTLMKISPSTASSERSIHARLPRRPDK